MKRHWLACVSLLLLLAAACEKDEFTEPSSLELKFKARSAEAMDGSLTMSQVVIQADRLEIEGRRDAAEDVFFERSLGTSLPVHAEPSISLDLPQGIYNRLAIKLVFDPDEAEEAEANAAIEDLLDGVLGDVLSPEDEAELGELILGYTQGKPALIYSGTYRKASEDLEVVMVINDPFTLEATAQNGSGGREVVLESGRENHATLYLDVEKWFSVLPAPQLERAMKGSATGKKYVLIHKKVNPGLFNMLYNRIEQYTTLVVNE